MTPRHKRVGFLERFDSRWLHNSIIFGRKSPLYKAHLISVSFLFSQESTMNPEIIIELPNTYNDARKFYDGDHLQSLSGWGGPLLPPNDDKYATMIDNITRAFRSKNVIKEVIKTSLSAILGRNISWEVVALVDDAATQELAAEAGQALGEWWGERKINRSLFEAGIELKLSQRGVLRVVVPDRFINRTPPATLKEALKRVYCHVPSSAQATVTPHPTPMSEYYGLYRYSDIKGGNHHELCYLDEFNQTVIETESGQTTHDLGGLLPIYAMSVGELFISPQLLQQQKSLNFALTMGQKNLEYGYAEMFFFNVELPVQYDPVTKLPAVDPRTKAPKVMPITTGPGTRNNLIGKVTKDKDGNISIANPSVQRFDPIPIDVYRGSEEWFYEVMLAECNQLHFLLNGQAVVSGESRRQALQGFLSSLSSDIEEFELAIKWLLQIALRYAAILQGDPTRYDNLGFSVTITPDSGPMTGDEKAQLREDYKVGLISLYSFLIERGYDHQEATTEIQRISDELAEKMQREQAAMANAFVGEAQQVTQ